MNADDLLKLFGTAKPMLGMLHAPALPGSPANTLSFAGIRDWVLRDADALASGGVDGMILENFGDAPFYPRRVPPHTVAFLAVLGSEVAGRFPLPLGVNVLRNDALSAIAVAAAAGARFVRVNVYTGARLTDQGIVEGEAHEALRYRKLLGADVMVFADVAVKHSAPLGPRDLRDEVEDTIQRGRADAIVVSGSATGKETSVEDLRAAKAAAGDTAVLVGSGVNPNNLREVLACADGLIVGTAFKENGRVENPVRTAKVEAMADLLRDYRS